MAECHLVIIKRNGEDLSQQLLAPGTEWKIGKSVTADIRVRIDGVEDEHGVIKVDKNGKVCVRNFSAENPLMINGKPFQKQQVVASGDHLSIINRSFRFDIKEPVLKQRNAPQLTSTPDQVSAKSILLQRRISGIENYRSSPRPAKSRRSTPGVVGILSRNDTPIPSDSLYKSWRSSLSVNSSSLDKIQEDVEEAVDLVDGVQQCLFAEPAPVNKPRRSTRRSSIRRSVIFGPALSPEYFDKSLPPNTPLKKGTMPPSNSFIAEQQLTSELEQIVEEEEAQNSYSELFSSPRKAAKSPTSSGAKGNEPKSPKRLPTPAKKKPELKKTASPAKASKEIRKSYGGVSRKGTKQNRSSLPASMKHMTAIKLIGGKLVEDSTDGAAFRKPKSMEPVDTPKMKKSMLKDKSAKKTSCIKDHPISKRRSFVTGNAMKSSKDRRSLPSSVLMKTKSDTSVVPYIPVFYPVEDVSTLPQEESSEMSTEDVSEEESEIRLSLPTPLKKSIQGGVPLRRTKPKLWTPLRVDLESGVVLRKLHQALPTPVRKAIASNPFLRATKKALATPLRKEIEGQPKLRATKKALATPLRKQIEGQPKLRATKKALATPLRKQIEGQPKLRVTKKVLATPLRKEIEGQHKLRATRKAMATPVREEIKAMPKLRKTKKALATPLRREIEGQPKLRATKKALATPLRKEIEGQPKLRATRKAMATSIRKEIEGKPKLRAIKKKMATPLRKDIERKPKLRAVMKSLPTPLKMDIRKTLKLRQTKPRMATPLQQSIKQKPSLRKILKSLPTPVRQEIESQPTLRQTKKMLPLPLREEISQHPPLKPTRKRMATPLRQAIENAPPLRVTKMNENAPLTEKRVSKRRQSRNEDDLPPKKKAKAVVTLTEDLSPPLEYGELQRLFKDTKTRCRMPQGDAIFQGMKRMFRTPRSKDLSPDFEGLMDLFNTSTVSTNVTPKKVKFMSPVAMTAKRSTRSTAVTLPVNSPMILNVSKIDPENIMTIRRTRSKGASMPLVLEDPLPTEKPSQKPRTRKSTATSTIPKSEDATVTPKTRSLRSRSLGPPVNETAPVEVKKRATKKQKEVASEETKEVPEVVVTKRRTRAMQPVTASKETEEVPVAVVTKRRTRATHPVNDIVASPVRKTRQSKTKKQAETRSLKSTTPHDVSVSTVVRRTRRSQVTRQEDVIEVVNAKKSMKDVTENNVKDASAVVRRTRSRTIQQEVAVVEVATDTKKRKTSSNVADSDVENVTVSPVVRRTRRSRITQQDTVSASTKTKKITMAKKAVLEVKKIDEAPSGLMIRSVKQSPIVKVIVPVKTTVVTKVTEPQNQNPVRRSSRRQR